MLAEILNMLPSNNRIWLINKVSVSVLVTLINQPALSHHSDYWQTAISARAIYASHSPKAIEPSSLNLPVNTSLHAVQVSPERRRYAKQVSSLPQISPWLLCIEISSCVTQKNLIHTKNKTFNIDALLCKCCWYTFEARITQRCVEKREVIWISDVAGLCYKSYQLVWRTFSICTFFCHK